MSDVIQIRPRASETFVCPCGGQWFSRSHRFDKDGHCIESSDYMVCDSGCGRKHKLRKAPE